MSIALALAVSAAITLIVLAATWVATRRAIAIAPRDALWRELSAVLRSARLVLGVTAEG